jgi:hypothetical protein
LALGRDDINLERPSTMKDGLVSKHGDVAVRQALCEAAASLLLRLGNGRRCVRGPWGDHRQAVEHVVRDRRSGTASLPASCTGGGSAKPTSASASVPRLCNNCDLGLSRRFRRARLVIVSPDSRANLARRQAGTPLIVLCRFRDRLSYSFDKLPSLGGRPEEISQIWAVWGKAVAV